MPQCHFRSIIGSRVKNEDCYLVNDELGLYAVADGIGGGFHGELASRMSIECLQKSIKEGLSLAKAFEAAQEELISFSKKRFGEAVMGTTLTALHCSAENIRLAHIGDSRCYKVLDGILNQLTEDHEIFEESMNATVLASYIGMPCDLVALPVQLESFARTGPQRFLLATDGLHRQLSEREILKVLTSEPWLPEIAADRLCELAGSKEDSDNITVLLLDLA
jgi:protein phosphatase